MKTSLVLAESLYKEAKRYALEHGLTLSEVISRWAELGRGVATAAQKSQVRKEFKPRSLGKPKLDLTSREFWMEALEDDRD